jgi:hypothetical protein
MSVRTFSLFEPPKPRDPGSIFGTAIPAPSGGFWKRLAVSPPRTPPTEACKYAPLPPEFHLEAPAPTVPTATQVDSVLPTWLHRFNDAALVTFHQVPGVTTLRASPRLECTNMVHVTKVCADSADWRPLACDAPGKVGHLFTLAHEGRPTCKIEATVATATDEIARLVVVQPEYSPISIAAKTVPESTLLIFENVRGHIDSLRHLKHTLLTSADTGYVPTRELVTTGAFGALVLTTDHSPEAFEARRHWKRVQLLLTELSSATADCVDTFNRSELKRVGQCLPGLEEWRKEV